MATDIKMDNEELTESLNNKVDVDALKQYLPLTGGSANTIKGSLYFGNSCYLLSKNPTYAIKDVPDHWYVFDMVLRDKNNEETSILFQQHEPDGGTSIGMGLKDIHEEPKEDENGKKDRTPYYIALWGPNVNEYSGGTKVRATCTVPMPDTSSNSTDIATTQWVTKKLSSTAVNVSNVISKDQPAVYTFPEGGTYKARVEFTSSDNSTYIENGIFSGGDTVTPTSNKEYTSVNVIGMKIL